MFLIAVNTSLLPCSCSFIDSVRWALIFLTCSARVKILLKFPSTVFDDTESVSISAESIFKVVVIVFPCTEDSSASFLISSATTAKPLPASPACAASIAAFIANKFVCDAMCWMTLDASSKEPDSSAIFCVTVFDVTIVALPLAVAVVSSLIALSVLVSVCPIEAIFATISSIDDDDCATLAACISMPVFNCLMVRTISSTVAAVSVTLAAWVIAWCFTPSIFALIWCTALAVSVILVDNVFPISSIWLQFTPIDLIAFLIFVIVSLKYSDKSVISSFPVTGRLTVKSPSPCAIFFKAETVRLTGFIIPLDTK